MKHLSLFFLASFLFLGFHSCVDNEIDEPPVKETPQLDTNGTIADVLALRTAGQNIEITEDITFDAIVVADDESGNFYKSVVIEDETAGITVRIEANNVYTALPVGRKVFVRAKGLFVGDFNGLPQIGFGDDDGDLLTIPFSLVGDTDESKLIPSDRDQTITPTVLKISEINSSHLNTLISIENVQFDDGEIGKTYADAVNEQTENRDVIDCDGTTIIIRTSGFSDFAGETLAEGNGTLTCVYTVFGSTKQLVIRDPSDVAFTNERCGVVIDLPDANATIADLMALYNQGSVTNITSDLVFDAIVTADDLTGNFYKQIVVEDETGAINIQIDAFDLYEDFSMGKKVVVKATGLAIGDFNGLPQIGIDNGDQVGRIPESAYKSFVFPGSFEGERTPTTMTLEEAINSTKYNSLILLNDVEFGSNELGSTYADGANQQSENLDVKDCNNNSIILRTSGFSDFADVVIPEQNGSLEAILSIFGTTKQLVIRNLQDVNFNGQRCGGTNPDLPEPNSTIADLMFLYSEGMVTDITNDLIFDAVVTADDETGNFYKQVVVEDETGAINIQIDAFDLFEDYSIGTRIVVKAKDLAIGDFNGLPQIGINNGDQVGRIPEATYQSFVFAGDFEGEVTPTSMTIDEALNSDKLNSLISLSDVEFASSELGSTYADAANTQARNLTVSDCDENVIILRTSGFSDFADNTIPDQNGSLEAILSIFGTTKQLVIRNTQDVSFNSERCDGTGTGGDLEELNEDFSSVPNDQDVSLNGWTNEVITGVRKWRGKEFSGNTYIQATAFSDDEPSMETWIVTPKIVMNGNNTLNFQSAMAFYQHDGLTVHVSTDYNGDASSATWTEVNATLAGSGQGNYDFVDSGVIDLSSFSGSAVIGFKYEGTSGGNTTTYIIDDVIVTK